MIWLGTALLLGLASSLHCVGMCGPIVLAMNSSRSKKMMTHITLYHIGRIGTYVGLGFIFGMFGKQLFLFGYQQSIAVVAGLGLIAYALFPILFKSLSFNHPLIQPIHRVWLKTSNRVMRQKSNSSSLMMGALNGLLPCGMVYAALAGALATQGLWEGAGFMLAFGLGTSPLLTAVVFSQKLLKTEWRERMRAYQPLVLTFAALLMIFRGADLDWGMFSPSMIANQVFIAICN